MSKENVKRRLKRTSKLRLRPIAMAVAVALGNAVMSLPASACFTPSASCAAIVTDTVTVINTLDIDPLEPGTPTIPAGSLRDAINCANSRPTINKIKFTLPNALTDKTVMLEENYPCEAYLQVTKAVTIQGQNTTDPVSTVITGINGQLFSSNSSLTLEGMTLTKVNTTISNGRAITIVAPDPYAPQTLTLKHTLVTGHHVNNASGGAIYATDANLIIENSTISNNSSSFDNNSPYVDDGGGGIHINESTGGSSGTLTLSLTNSLLSHNDAINRSGGAIFAKHTDITLENSTVSNNSSSGHTSPGGGIYSYGDVTLTGSTISNNKTVGSSSLGGGIRSSGTVTLTNSTVKDNKTVGGSSSGGGISAASVDINLSTITGNSTDGGDSLGGGISSGGGTIMQSSITNNHTSGKSSPGGGIGARSGHFNIYNSTLSNNYTGGTNNAGIIGKDSSGGAIYTSSVTLKQSTISGNSIKGGGSSAGGAIYVRGAQTDFGFVESPTEIIQSTITENYSDSGSTGGVSIKAGKNDTVILNSIISGNNTSLSNNTGNLSFTRLNTSTNTINFTSSLIGDPVASFTPIGTNDGNNFFNTLAVLLPLSSDVGEPTETHTPDTSSPSNPIIDGGDSSKHPYPLDQRGEQRVQGSAVDIGSVEAKVTTPAAVCVAKQAK